MNNNLHVADEVSRLYEKLQIKRDKLKEQLEEVEKDFEAVSNTLRLMGLPTPGLSNIDLTGKSHLDAMMTIAKANGGILVVKTARRLMARGGMFKHPKNASSILFTAISRSGKFKSVGKGTYELLTESKEPKNVIPPAVPVTVEPNDEDIPF
jgi:hypothetical protein